MIRVPALVCLAATLPGALSYALPEARAEFIASVDNTAPDREMNMGCTFWEDSWVLNCRNVMLTTVPAAKLWPMKKAIHMWFDNNQITTLASTTFEMSTDVQFLFLQNNAISVIETGAFSAMRRLRVLNLANNQVPSMPPGLNTLSELEILDVHSNAISALTPSDLPDAEGSVLRYLNLADNSIVEVNCGTFNAAPEILRLDMASNPTVCGFDPLTNQVHCECAAFGKGSLVGGNAGYCSNTCRIEPEVPPARTPSGTKALEASFSAAQVLLLLQSFNTEPSFRYEVYTGGAAFSGDSTPTTMTSWSSGTVLVVACACLFLVAAIGFTAHSTRVSLREKHLMPTLSVSEDSQSTSQYTATQIKGMRHYPTTTLSVGTLEKSSKSALAPVVIVSGYSEADDMMSHISSSDKRSDV